MKTPDYVRYEQLKAALQEQGLTPEEYTRELQRIAELCGV